MLEEPVNPDLIINFTQGTKSSGIRYGQSLKKR